MLCEHDKSNYRNLVKSLMYLAIRTRLDIPVATSMNRSHIDALTRAHLKVARRTLWTLRGTSKNALILELGLDDQVGAFVDEV